MRHYGIFFFWHSIRSPERKWKQNTKKDIKIEFEESILSISGEKVNDENAEETKTYLSEIRNGKFLRKVKFPSLIETEKIKAHYENGLLALTIPKSEKSKATLIEIN